MKPVSEWGFYFITDRKLSKKPVVETVKDAISGGARVVQYREKELPREQMLCEAREISELCKNAGVVFLVNDYPELALGVGADGVHVGQSDASYKQAREILGPEKIVGVSATTVEEAVKAADEGADYIGLGPIYPTGTKADAAPAIGVEAIREAAAKTSKPIIAIGGITLENTPEVVGAGACSVCAISAVVCSGDIAGAVRGFNRAVESARDKNALG